MRTFHHIGNGVYRVPMRRSAVTNQFIPEKEQTMNSVKALVEHRPDESERAHHTDE